MTKGLPDREGPFLYWQKKFSRGKNAFILTLIQWSKRGLEVRGRSYEELSD
ncbi:hypothetical protein BAT02nite_29060 [Bacillus atrophaeus]|uniref:Uncharacterized protein n=1 Tax=Bacillus atrophaeus (strain 1942) TaxID=720555 RepID=A0ABM5LXH2_BACA1|nr:hypothetical protein BATR1942_08595 [Bacillus atrophaeus 1942]EIM11890.1 hypothetical protein UY9_04777 [Bacillus atrophaeus C89]GED03262.1 hypothetical protein BAT02nite_29060 [Bacillus atrophaeus]